MFSLIGYEESFKKINDFILFFINVENLDPYSPVLMDGKSTGVPVSELLKME